MTTIARLGAAAALGGAVAIAAAGTPAGAARARPPAQVVTSSMQALGRAPFVTLNGFDSMAGGRFGILVRSARGGSKAAGTLSSTSKGALGFLGNVSFVRLGSTFYLRGNQRFWASSTGGLSKRLLAALGGQWIQLPGGEVKQIAGEFGAFTNPSRLATSLFGSVLHERLTLGPSTTVDGQPAISVRSPKGTLYVAARGTPLPLQLAAATSGKGAIRFGYPRSITIVPPPGSKTLAQIERAVKAAGG